MSFPAASLRELQRARRPVAEPFAAGAFLRVSNEQGTQHADEVRRLDVLFVETVQAGVDAVATNINLLEDDRFADEADFGSVGPDATIRTTGEAQRDLVILQTKLLQHVL